MANDANNALRQLVGRPAATPLDIKYGRVYVTLVSANYVIVDVVDGDQYGVLTLFGVSYNLSLSLRRTPQGWRPCPRFKNLPDDKRPLVFTSRQGGTNYMAMSDKNIQRVLDVLLPAVDAFLATQGKELCQAQVAEINNNLYALEAELIKARFALAELETKRRELWADLTAAQVAVEVAA